MKRVLVVGFGNVGLHVAKFVEASDDMELSGIATRRPENVGAQTSVPVYDLNKPGIIELMEADVAILCYGSAELKKKAPDIVRRSPAPVTVDSCDDHAGVPVYYSRMDDSARAADNLSVICEGWDPGALFSAMRVFLEALFGGNYVTCYGICGGGLSMGHSDALRQIEGIRDARSYTHTRPEALRGSEVWKLTPTTLMWRENFLVLEPGVDEEVIERVIATHPYFIGFEVINHLISEEVMRNDHSNHPHNGMVWGGDESGSIELRVNWESNPAGTAKILVASARAGCRLYQEGKTGAFLPHQIPLGHFSALTEEELLHKV